MNIREFNYHQRLASLGLVNPFLCLEDTSHGRLFANTDSNDKEYLFCLACDFKLYPGSEFSLALKNKIKTVMKEVLDAERERIAKKLY